MLSRITATSTFGASAAPARGFKVAVLGASGGIGQPLSMLMKMNPRVTALSLYDIVGAPGVAADLSHVPTVASVSGHAGAEQLGECLSGADVVVIPAGVPRKPGMTRDDLFNTNASIVQTLANGVAQHCPDAMVAIISNPVNSTVPIAAETLKKAGKYNPRRVFGVTTLDVLRANTFVAEALGKDPAEVEVTVVGGHAGITILPLLSQVPGLDVSAEQIADLTDRIQNGGTHVVQAKADSGLGGSATLSMAAAGARFADSLLRAMGGEAGVSECAFVESDKAGTEYFSTRIELGPDGVKSIGEVGPMSDYEKENFEKMLPELKASIEKGKAFVSGN